MMNSQFMQYQGPPAPVVMNLMRQSFVPSQANVHYVPVRQVLVEGKKQDDEPYIRRLEEEIEVWRSRYLQLETAYQVLMGLEQRLEIQESRISILREENQKLNFQLRENINNFESQRIVWFTVELENHDLKMSKLQLTRLTELFAQRHEELQASRKQCTLLEVQLSGLASAEITIRDLEKQLELSWQDVELWKQKYDEVHADRAAAKLAARQATLTLTTSITEDLKKSEELQRMAYLSETRNLRIQIERLILENEDLKKKLQTNEVNNYEQNTKRQELEAKLKSQQVINERIDASLKEKSRDNAHLKISLSRLDRGITA